MRTGSMQKCDLAVQTQDVVTAYYLLDTGPLFANIAPNCIWTAPNHATYRGTQAIRETLSQPSGMPRFSMYDAHFEVLDDDSPDVAVVMGAYRLLSDVDYQQIMAAGQHATAVWRLFDEGWKIILLHVSNEWAESNPEELYPFKVGRQTWRYAQAIIERGIGGEPQALVLRGGCKARLSRSIRRMCFPSGRVVSTACCTRLKAIGRLPARWPSLRESFPTSSFAFIAAISLTAVICERSVPRASSSSTVHGFPFQQSAEPSCAASSSAREPGGQSPCSTC